MRATAIKTAVPRYREIAGTLLVQLAAGELAVSDRFRFVTEILT